MKVKQQINVYKGLPMVLEKVKSVALSAVIGKSNGWLNLKLGHYEVKGRKQEFYEQDIPLLNDGLNRLGDEILNNLVVYGTEREQVIEQMKALAKIVCMPYIYGEVLKKPRLWYANRTRKRSSEGKASSFAEDDILRINMAAMNIANELKSTEFTL